MSASREKKSRQSDPTQGLTQKERKELQEQQAAKRKAVVYTVIGVIVAVLVAALLIWHSGIFQRGKTALTVGGRDYSVTDVNYYFTYYMNQAYSTSGGAFDPSKDLRTQYTDEEQTKSYFDQFLDSTIEQLKKISALETAASEAGYTLSDDDKAYVDEAISSTKKAAESYGYAYDGYLKAMYGKYMTPSAFKTCVERVASTWRFRLVRPTVSWSTSVRAPTPERARASAHQLPTPPRPNTATWAAARRSMAWGPKSISVRRNLSSMQFIPFQKQADGAALRPPVP